MWCYMNTMYIAPRENSNNYILQFINVRASLDVLLNLASRTEPFFCCEKLISSLHLDLPQSVHCVSIQDWKCQEGQIVHWQSNTYLLLDFKSHRDSSRLHTSHNFLSKVRLSYPLLFINNFYHILDSATKRNGKKRWHCLLSSTTTFCGQFVSVHNPFSCDLGPW